MIDLWILRHLNEWLDRQFDGDTMRDAIRSAMVAVVATDEEYWGAQSWWRVYDEAKCDRIREAMS